MSEMKNTGIVRGIDNLGRVVLPKELRTTMGLAPDSKLEIYADKGAIVLKKYQPKEACAFCGTQGGDLIEFEGKYICAACRARITAL